MFERACTLATSEEWVPEVGPKSFVQLSFPMEYPAALRSTIVDAQSAIRSLHLRNSTTRCAAPWRRREESLQCRR
jgi:hypothetical protein